MYSKQSTLTAGVLAVLVWGIGLAPSAFAVDANTQVNNSASVSYEVNSEAQPTVNSNTETFYVDIAVDFVITENDSGTPVAITPGGTSYTSFTLTNNANSDLFFDLTADNAALTAFDGASTDSGIDMTNFVIYNDDTGANPGNGIFDGDEDIITSTQVEVAANGGTLNILVAADAPATGNDGDVAVIELAATVVDSDGDPIAMGDQANTFTFADWSGHDDSVQVVFVEDVGGKVNGAEDDTGSNDGSGQGTSAFVLQSADLVVSKSSAIIDDTLGGTAYHVPNAVVEYTIVVENLGAADATSVAITDSIATANVTYVGDNSAYTTGDVRIRQYGTGEGATSNGACDGVLGTTTIYAEGAGDGSTDNGSDGVVYDDTNDEIEVQASVGLTVPADACVEIQFQVTIN